MRDSFERGQDTIQPRVGVVRLPVPQRGHVLSTVVETYAKPIRDAVAILSNSLIGKQCGDIRAASLSARVERPSPNFARSDEELAAWALVSMWIVGVAVKALSAVGTLSEAEQWFSRSKGLTTLLSAHAMSRAEAVLRVEADALTYFELLPYVLDPHGPGSRMSVRRDPETYASRSRKRAEGVFYTPADVAEYMARACLREVSSENLPRVFDPACGTGVFLRASLQALRRRYASRHAFSLASECLFGADIDPWPLDATAFVLLADSWNDVLGNGRVPAELWRRLRMNVACIDTLRIDPAASGVQDQTNDLTSDGRVSISRLFPAMAGGPSVILGNPPYSDLGRRSDLGELARVYKTLAVKPKPNSEVYLPFIEQMIRLADREVRSGALVLPLSIACNISPQFAVARELISRTPGRWRFAFFDREPHALFGEDVKTRNAVILWSRTLSDVRSKLSTGPLRKWRSDSREAMFRSLRFTEIDRDIRAGIPKVEGERQAAVHSMLKVRWGRLDQVAQSIGRAKLVETADLDDRTVLVGATAYNFLNVFLKPPRGTLREEWSLSDNPLHALRCASRKDALAVFGILSTHLVYWWWHVHGDGFHVSRRFVAELPFGGPDFSASVTEALAERGAALWAAIKEKPIISLNRGRTSLAFTPNGHDDVRRRLDEILANRVGLEAVFVDELQRWTALTVAARLPENAVTQNQERS